MNKFFMIPNKKDVSVFNEELILPLEDYSIGFDVYFSVQEIKQLSSVRDVSVIINKFLHKDDINNIREIISNLDSVKYFFIEDLGLVNLIDKERIVINQNHIISNYRSVNYFKRSNIDKVVLSNELTIEELKEVRANTSSQLFYFLINKNMLMYSKRKLVNSYYTYKNIESDDFKKLIVENVSKKELIVKEEKYGTVIFDNNIFSGNEFMNELTGFNFIINFNNMSEEEASIVMKYYNDSNISEYVRVDNYFMKNKIGYKVGDLK